MDGFRSSDSNQRSAQSANPILSRGRLPLSSSAGSGGGFQARPPARLGIAAPPRSRHHHALPRNREARSDRCNLMSCRHPASTGAQERNRLNVSRARSSRHLVYFIDTTRSVRSTTYGLPCDSQARRPCRSGGAARSHEKDRHALRAPARFPRACGETPGRPDLDGRGRPSMGTSRAPGTPRATPQGGEAN